MASEVQYNKEYFKRYRFPIGLRGKVFREVIKKKEPMYRILTRQFEPGSRLLDLGCGLGHFLSCAENYFKTWGVDISPYALSKARGRTNKTAFCQADSKELTQFKPGFFDIVTAFDLVEHVLSPEQTVEEVNRVLRTGGAFVLSTPNPASLGVRLKKEEWMGFRDPTHQSVKSKKEWEQILEKNNFTITRVIYDYLWDTPYTNFLPLVIEELLLKLPTYLLFYAGLGSGKALGETIYIVAEKK